MDSANGGESADLDLAAHCLDYVEGFLDGFMGPKAVCLNGTSNGTLVRVYVLYMQKNPKLLDDYRSVGLSRSVVDAYPCLGK
jgi:hypothetical protein